MVIWPKSLTISNKHSLHQKIAFNSRSLIMLLKPRESNEASAFSYPISNLNRWSNRNEVNPQKYIQMDSGWVTRLVESGEKRSRLHPEEKGASWLKGVWTGARQGHTKRGEVLVKEVPGLKKNWQLRGILSNSFFLILILEQLQFHWKKC